MNGNKSKKNQFLRPRCKIAVKNIIDSPQRSSQTVGILHYVQINIIKIILGFLNIYPDLDCRAKDHAGYSTSVMIWIPVESWLRYATQAARRKVIDVHHCFHNELAYTVAGIFIFCLKNIFHSNLSDLKFIEIWLSIYISFTSYLGATNMNLEFLQWNFCLHIYFLSFFTRQKFQLRS